MPVGVGTAEDGAAAADLAVIGNDKSSEILIDVVIVHHERASRLDCQAADLISLQTIKKQSGRPAMAGRDVALNGTIGIPLGSN